MGDDGNGTKDIYTRLDAGDLAAFERVKAHHGIRSNAETLRVLIHQEARRLERPGQGSGVRTILDAYLGGLITSDEALEALAGRYELIPA